MKYLKLYKKFRLFEAETSNCFDNQKLTIVQPLPHNFTRKGKDVICKEKVVFDQSKPSILLLPGGDGKPAVDFEHISKAFTGYNLFSMNYDQDKFGSIDTWSQEMAESALNVIPGKFSIVSFSLGGSIGFFAIRDKFSKSNKFTNRIVFIDAGIPVEGTGDDKKDFIDHVNRFCGVQNPPLKYSCMRKSKIEQSEEMALSSEDVLDFRYKFKTPFDMVENEKHKFGKTRNKALFSKLEFDEKKYENWRGNLHKTEPHNGKSYTMICEYLDDPTKPDRSHTLVDDKPSAIYLNGKLIVDENGKFNPKVAKEKQKELKITDKDIWVVRDKAEGFKLEGTTKQFWWEDPWQKAIFEWTKKHIQNTAKKIKKGEKLPKGVKALYIGAGGTNASPMSENDKKEIMSKSPTKVVEDGEGDTQFEFIQNCTHGNMLEDKKSSAQIANSIVGFFNSKL